MNATHSEGGAMPADKSAPPTGLPVNLPDALNKEQDCFLPTETPVATSSPAQNKKEVNFAVPLSFPWLESAVAASLLVLGFCYWEWGLLYQESSGLGDTLFFLVCIALALVYLHLRGIKQNVKSSIALAVAIGGALPFLLYGSRDFNALIWMFEASACLIWIAYSCKTIIAPHLSGFLAVDLIRQLFIVPFANFGRFFTSPFAYLPKKGRKIAMPLVTAGISLIIFIPIALIIVSLLAESDDGFYQMLLSLSDAFEKIDLSTLMQWIFNLVFGIPIAAYIFGSIAGNSLRRKSRFFNHIHLKHTYTKAQVLGGIAFYVPLILLIIMYVSYFVAMGSYLTSALASELPDSFTYAEYARSGFFELCTVAAINLFLLGVVYLFAKRLPGTYPIVLRVLTAVLTLLTMALVVTAASKMLLYIDIYGLSPLRLYTSVFMLLLLVVFGLIMAWHIKPFNAARPCIIATIALFLALSLVNTDGLIANYNVRQYLDGNTEQIDPDMLGGMSDAALPALQELANEATDPWVQESAEDAIDFHNLVMQEAFTDSESRNHWYNWNLVSWQSQLE